MPGGQKMISANSGSRPAAISTIGRGILRLRLFWGWSQAELERRSGVDQTTISRLERGLQRGLSIRRLAAILDALRVGEVMFDRPATIPQTDLEIMLYGDPWKRAMAEADRRLRWPQLSEPGIGEPDAWFEDQG
jgi:transcriptional regulator with XRE-family HTH domain